MAVKVAINGFGRIDRANMRWLTRLRLERIPSQLTEKKSRSMQRLTQQSFRGERSA